MAPQPIPKTKFTDMIDALNEMVRTDKVNRVLLSIFKTEAEELKKNDFALGFAALGMIACVEKNLREMHDCHKNSLHYSGNAPEFMTLYAVSLLNSDLYPEALKHALKAYQSEPLNLRTLNVIIKASYELESPDLIDYLNKWLELTGNDHEIVEKIDLIFPEDDPEKISEHIETFEKLIQNDHSLLIKPDKALFDLADELTQGVGI